MPAYSASQAYDAPASFLWSVLTDFETWPAWFPRMTQMRVLDGQPAARGAGLMAIGENVNEWTHWTITEWSEPALLVCEYNDSNVPVSHGLQAAYLQFELFDDPEGCTLEVELGAEGYNALGDFFVGMTLGTGARRMLPRLVNAFSEHVVQRAAAL